MSNRNSLLGRSKAREKLTREELAALDKVTVTSRIFPRRRRSNRRSRLSRRAVVRSERYAQGSAEVSLEHRVP